MGQRGIWMWNPDKTARSIWPEDKVAHFESYGWTLAPPPIEYSQAFGDLKIKVLSYPPNNYDGYSTCYHDIMNSLRFGGLTDSDDAEVYFYYRQPQQIEAFDKSKKIIFYTMIETTNMPSWWPQILNDAGAVYVPSMACKEVFDRSLTLKKPVQVLPHGVHTKFLKRQRRENSAGVWKFLHLNAFGDNRKGWREILEAWNIAGFSTRNDVSLTLKTVYSTIPDLPEGTPKNVNVVQQKMNRDDVLRLYYDHHCFIFPSYGEGFGLPPVEAMSTGMPVITINGTGMHEYVKELEGNIYIAKHTEPGPKAITYSHFPKEDMGNFHCLVDTASLAERMKYVVDHQDEAIEKGIQASQIIKKKFSYSNYGRGLAKAVEQQLGIKNDVVFFTPSLNDRCGIWKYTQYLAQELHCRALTNLDSLFAWDEDCPIIFQHHYGIASLAILDSLYAHATEKNVPVLAMMHSYQKGNRDNDRILLRWPVIVHSQFLKKMILEDYPDADISVIPHGCIAPQEGTGKNFTVGAFGFNHANKNFQELEDWARASMVNTHFLKSSQKKSEIFYTEQEILDELGKCKYVMSFATDPGIIEHSGSNRFLLASGRPVILKKALRNQDIPKSCYHEFSEEKPFPTEEEAKKLIENAKKYCQRTSWPIVAKKYLQLAKKYANKR